MVMWPSIDHGRDSAPGKLSYRSLVRASATTHGGDDRPELNAVNPHEIGGKRMGL